MIDLNEREQPGPSEEIITPETVTDSTYWNKRISELFLIGDMPKEFYDLWSFCKRQCSTHPEGLMCILFLFV